MAQFKIIKGKKNNIDVLLELEYNLGFFSNGIHTLTIKNTAEYKEVVKGNYSLLTVLYEKFDSDDADKFHFRYTKS
jgi:hypothetical protein